MLPEGKRKTRQMILGRRNALTPEEIAKRSRSVQDSVLRSKFFQSAKSLGAYFAFGSEVRTDVIIGKAKELGKQVALPTVEGDKIAFYEMSAAKYLVKGRFGIMEPLPYGKITGLDLIIVPGIAYDRTGYRLGYGKGYYDRFLLEHRTFSVGLAYSFQVVERLPHGRQDMRVDAVATEGRLITPVA
ncbi:MAG: 5-formyltetrahydrofolate cyclo-ligase [Nitrososphaera sp.]